ncbi:hypothetical protein Taro_001411 [Colocasia esculenta]|uniref:FCP1 homology domain-containing protein n=1 Tax=Colocasia esculenta TaxID=4460 RepID=A0A843TI02_COLES|nr:hypothetical protein [Colocasia esculenta]
MWTGCPLPCFEKMDLSKCTPTGFNTLENRHKPLVLKELKKLWNKEDVDLPWEIGDYSPSNTLLIDDSPYKALCNPPHTAIFPIPYDYRNEMDYALGESSLHNADMVMAGVVAVVIFLPSDYLRQMIWLSLLTEFNFVSFLQLAYADGDATVSQGRGTSEMGKAVRYGSSKSA